MFERKKKNASKSKELLNYKIRPIENSNYLGCAQLSIQNLFSAICKIEAQVADGAYEAGTCFLQISSFDDTITTKYNIYSER